MRRIIFPVCLVILLFTGCATHYIWTETPLDDFYEPGSPNGLHVYQSLKKHDFLVRYDESAPSSDSLRRRFYFANENKSRVQLGHRPHFISHTKTNGLQIIPLMTLNGAEENKPELYASPGAKEDQFSILRANGECLGTFDLPTYPSHSGTVKRVLLTPVSLALDVTVIGGILYLQSGAPGIE